MKRFSEQFHKQSKSVSLQALEREALRERLHTYMEYHPLPGAAPKKKILPAMPNALAFTDTLISLPTKFIYRAGAVAAVFLFIVVPAIAEKAVPGDNLYAVKVRFNEEVYSTLIFDQKEKVAWETERLNRRIAEARLLASEGRLNGEVGAQVAEAVREHAEVVKQEIEELRGDDADAAVLASIELNTTLKTQSTSIVETQTLATADVGQVLVDALNESVAIPPDEASAIPAYDKIMARVEQNTTRSYELLQSTNLDEADPLRGEITRRLDDVGRSITEANNNRATDEASASRQLIDVLERTQKIIVYLSDLDANRAISLETVVPKILTEDEKKGQLAAFNVEVNHKIEILEALKPKLNRNVADKVTYSIKAAKQKQDEANADVSRMTQGYGSETLAMLADTLKLVEDSGVPAEDIPAEALLPTDETASTTATTTEKVTEDE